MSLNLVIDPALVEAFTHALVVLSQSAPIYAVLVCVQARRTKTRKRDDLLSVIKTDRPRHRPWPFLRALEPTDLGLQLFYTYLQCIPILTQSAMVCTSPLLSHRVSRLT
jgi:hypothetical protein